MDDQTPFVPDSETTQNEPITRIDPIDPISAIADHDEECRPATLQERFAAFVTDSIFFTHLLGAWLLALTYFTRGDLLHPLNLRNTGKLLFASTGVGLYFLYYFFFEGVLTATPGKILGGLSIQRKKGGTPSLFAILVRNLFRLIDYPLFFLTGVGFIEATSRRQRLGDLVAGTVLMREVSIDGRRGDQNPEGCAGATRRTLAFLLDIILFAAFAYGLLMLIPVNRALVSRVALNLLPLAFLLYWTLAETLFQATFGKALLGMKVVQEDGRPARFSTVLSRNLFRLFDTNPIGYLSVVLSSHKQRPGDIVSGTLVVRDRKGFRVWLALPFMLLISAGAAYAGWRNPQNFFKQDYVIRIAQKTFDPIPMSLRRFTFGKLHVERVDFGFNEEEVNEKALFDSGNVIYVITTVSGYEVRGERAWLRADLNVQDSGGRPVLDKNGIINSSLQVGRRKSIRLATRFALNTQASPGRYQMTLTLTDLFGNAQAQESRSFYVRP